MSATTAEPMTLERVKDAIVILHWRAVMDKKPDTAWIQSLCAAAKELRAALKKERTK